MAPMGIASMIIGIVSLVIGFIPMCGFWAAAPAVVGLILGIVDLVLRSKRKQPRGKAIVGVILNPLAIIVIVAWTLLFVYGSGMPADQRITGFGQGWQQQPTPGWQPGPTLGPVPLQPGPTQAVPLQPMQPMQPMQPVQPVPPAQPAPPAPQPPPPPPPAP
jgi:hypothetical protein